MSVILTKTLTRIRIGNIRLGNLKEGETRELTPSEIHNLLSH